jgi:hypothetical protein
VHLFGLSSSNFSFNLFWAAALAGVRERKSIFQSVKPTIFLQLISIEIGQKREMFGVLPQERQQKNAAILTAQYADRLPTTLCRRPGGADFAIFNDQTILIRIWRKHPAFL